MNQYVLFEPVSTFAGVLTLFTAKGLLPAMNQLVPLQFGGSGEALVTKLTWVLFLKLFFQEGQLLQIVGRGLGHELAQEVDVSFVSFSLF